MTQEQKLEIVYKKLFNQKAYTKEGTKFFEEPLSTFSQVPLSYIYINSDWLPTVAPNGPVAVAGVESLTYVQKETSVPADSSGKRFFARNKRIIPFSYGTGYGIEMRTQSGDVIDGDYFPYTIDWESGRITFDQTPFDVDAENPPLLTYHFYSGSTLANAAAYTKQGQRGEAGPTGPTGPIDSSVLVYRGKTDFTVVPPVQYKANDVITFTTNGNSYICLTDTDDSPLASPSSWENLCPTGTLDQMPENVLYVNHPNAIPTSGIVNASAFYFTSLQDAIDNAADMVPTVIIVNQLNNQYPAATGNIQIKNKIIDIVFRQWANLSSDSATGFSLTIEDSDVTIENAQIGGGLTFASSDGINEVVVASVASDCRVRLIGCKVNSKLMRCTRTKSNNVTLILERCSVNSERIVTNSDLFVLDSTFSGSITADYTQEDVQGAKHEFQIINSFGFQRATRGSVRNLQAYDVVIMVDRNDTQSLSAKFENSMLPGIGIVLSPEAFLYSPDVVRIDSNNAMFYGVGLDERSATQGGTINVVGSNVSYGTNGNSFASRYFSMADANASTPETFFYSIDGPGGTQVPVVVWPNGSFQTTGYDAYKSLMLNELEKPMLSL